MNRKQTGFNLAFVLIAVMGVLVVQDFWARRQAVATIPYSEFQKLVREDKVASVVVGQDQLSGELKEPINGKKRFVAVRVDADIAKELDQHGVEYRGQFDSNFITMLLSWIVPTALFFGIWIFLGRRMAKQLGGPGGGGLMAIGKSKAKVYVETDTKVTFADVAGVDESKAELHALGRARGAVPGFGGHDEKEQTLNQLLVEMDGFDPASGIVLIAATNRPEILDPALLRAGRFDRQVLVDRPDRVGREQILKVHTRKVVLAADVKLEDVAALTPGFTGADLANLVNEAALVATRGGADRIGMNDFNVAIERIVAGL